MVEFSRESNPTDPRAQARQFFPVQYRPLSVSAAALAGDMGRRAELTDSRCSFEQEVARSANPAGNGSRFQALIGLRRREVRRIVHAKGDTRPWNHEDFPFRPDEHGASRWANLLRSRVVSRFPSG
jgi:hypothetical protein